MEMILARSLYWIKRWIGTRTILALSLLMVVLGSVMFGLAHLIRGLDTGLLLPPLVLGVSVGWLLAKSPFPGWLAGVVSFVLGVEVVLAHDGRLSRPLTALIPSLVELIGKILLWPWEGPPDSSSAALAISELESSVDTLLTHVTDWLRATISGQAAFDPVATALVWGLILWIVAAWAGWTVRRRQKALHAVVPATAVLAISLSYTWASPNSLQTLLGATLLLLVLTAQVAREHRWQAAGIDFSTEIRFDVAVVAIPLSMMLLTAAIITPSLSLRPVVRFAQRLLVEHLGDGKQVADSMGLEPLAGKGIALNPLRSTGLPNSSLIGSGPELSEQVVMLVYPEGQQPVDHPPFELIDAPAPRYYWRSVTYDHYTGRGWHTSETETVAYVAGEQATLVTSDAQRTLRQEVQAVQDLGGLLYRAGELVTADQDFNIAWRSPGDAFGAEIDATVYRADSLLPDVSEAELRAAGTDYPRWVLDRFLALPDELPARVQSLARDLTATAPTPYDQARAIETYLRTFTYTLDLPAPPPQRDVADYFLFDLRQGYCDYYATTMAVLARAVGLPTRFVVGYASGAYEAINARYVVTAADAHSWVEIYFPAYGWVEFEPTGGRPPIELPAEPVPRKIPEPQTALEPRIDNRPERSRLLTMGLLGSSVSLGLGGLAWWVVDRRRLRRLPPASAVAALYQRLYRHGHRLAVPADVGDTPYEFAAELTGRVTELAQERRSEAALSTISQQVHWLTDLYVRGIYSPHEPDSAEKAQAIRTWQRLRQKLWLAWVWQMRTDKRRGT